MAKAMIGIFLFLAYGVQAATVATFGGMHPVIEIDIREVIFKRLSYLEKTGALKKLQKKWIEQVQQKIERPTPLGLFPTDKPKTFYVDPTIVVNEDIYAEGRLLVPKGTRVNPFERVRLTKALFFFNGDDPKQVQWAKDHYKNYPYVKFILTGGSVKIGNEHFGRVYFDWEGRLSQKLQLKHVPSVVEQDNLRWKITEVGL